MPCTKQQKDQDRRDRWISIRSSFIRPNLGMRFADDDLENISISLPYYPPSLEHHPPPSPPTIQNNSSTSSSTSSSSSSSSSSSASQSTSTSPNFEDPTERIRISVQDTHISQRPYANELGGNVAGVLDSFAGNPSGQQDLLENPQVGHQQSNLSNHQEPSHHLNNSNEIVSNEGVQSSEGRSTHTGTSCELWSPHTAGVHNNNRNENESQDQQFGDSIKLSLNNDSQLVTGCSNINQNNDVTLNLSIQFYNSLLRSTSNSTQRSSLAQTSTASAGITKSVNIPQDISSSTISWTTERLVPSLLPGNRQTGVIKNSFYSGSSFSGFQKSKNESYEVNVKLKYVDYDSSYLCGYLCINHLTKSHPSLTTFFEGEIISDRHPFLTRKWEATEEIDRAHWSKFDDFAENYKRNYNLDSFSYDDLENSDYIYMRWKEQFLVPDHTIKQVEGASYAGFYYICYSKRTSSIRGYYFHHNSEHFER